MCSASLRMAHGLHLSFSRAGWFCKFGFLQESRPVVVLRFIEACTRPSAGATDRRRLTKNEARSVRIARASTWY